MVSGERIPTPVRLRNAVAIQRGIGTLRARGHDVMLFHVIDASHPSWEEQRLVVVGSEKMAVFDDGEATEKLRIYDKGADVNTDYDTFADDVAAAIGPPASAYGKLNGAITDHVP